MLESECELSSRNRGPAEGDVKSHAALASTTTPGYSIVETAASCIGTPNKRSNLRDLRMSSRRSARVRVFSVRGESTESLLETSEDGSSRF